MSANVYDCYGKILQFKMEMYNNSNIASFWNSFSTLPFSKVSFPYFRNLLMRLSLFKDNTSSLHLEVILASKNAIFVSFHKKYLHTSRRTADKNLVSCYYSMWYLVILSTANWFRLPVLAKVIFLTTYILLIIANVVYATLFYTHMHKLITVSTSRSTKVNETTCFCT